MLLDLSILLYWIMTILTCIQFIRTDNPLYLIAVGTLSCTAVLCEILAEMRSL